ncbi:MAG: sulfatase-like hydrolase/transferase [Proteobacteria bacterium]|nr:sulfatase-like hydrolase/transferase [Pseudomonadota bacterium]
MKRKQAIGIKNMLNNFIIRSAFIWWTGWLSLSLVEAGIWHTTGFPPLYGVLLVTMLIYSVAGIISGVMFAILARLIRRFFPVLEEPGSLIRFSMAACVSTVIFLYALHFFLKPQPGPPGLLRVMLRSIMLFSPALLSLAVLPFFFRWMERRGSLVISYLSLLPSLWIFTSLKLQESKELLPSLIRITTLTRTLSFVVASLLLFFLMYFLFSVIRRAFNRLKGIRFFTPALIGLSCIVLFLLFFMLLRGDGEREKRSGVKKASAGSPNIILITMDTARADHLSCYGYQSLTTPNLDRFSQEGVVFKNAYATNSWTLPSHASIFTGLYPSKHGADHTSDSLLGEAGQKQEYLDWYELLSRNFTKLSKEHQTLAEILSAGGYRTAGIIGGIFCNSIFGLSQGFDYYDDEIPFFNIRFFLLYQVIDRWFSLNDFFTQYGYLGKRIAVDLNSSAFKWLEKDHGQPFFLFINYMDAHTPYLPPPPYDGYFSKIPPNIILRNNPPPDASFVTAQTNLINSVISGDHQLTPEEKELTVSLYDGGILYLDHYLGFLFEKLKDLKAYDNTIIIITSDHGEAFGEHNQMEHGLTLYEEVLRVPLIIKYPSAYLQRGVIEKRVSLVDLMPTILSFLRYPIPPGIDGEALGNSDHPVMAELMMGIAKSRYKGSRDLRAVYQGREKYIWASNGSNEFYNLEIDPHEEENIIEKFPYRAEAMDRNLKQWLASFEYLKTEQERVKISKQTEEKLRALGYLK